MSLATGPLIANEGDEVELKVLMAAFDSDKQPVVTVSGGKVKETKDGAATVVANVSGSGEMKLSGTVAIAKKSGEMKRENWEHTIKIMKPEGNISLPMMNVMYENYDNIVAGTATGYDQTDLKPGLGLSSLRKLNGNQWVAVPASKVKKVSIDLYGKSSVNDKTVKLGSFPFDVKPLPKATVYYAGVKNGDNVNKTFSKLEAKYDPEIINLKVNFTVTKWELRFKGKTVGGSGGTLSNDALKLISSAKLGDACKIDITYTDGKSAKTIGGSFFLF
jgi:hypothetical protein